MNGFLDRGQLPHYEKPPVVETVLGVQFERLMSKDANQHWGLSYVDY